MRIIINDLLQRSNAPSALTTPALADTFPGGIPLITLAAGRTFDAVGIGNTDATQLSVNGDEVLLGDGEEKNGLYRLSNLQKTDRIVITHNGTYIGRIAIGMGRFLGCAPAREPGFWTTASSRLTASGQVIPGAGGITGRVIGVDFRYKIDAEIYADFAQAYGSQISRGFPFFLLFDVEHFRMPILRMYGATDTELTFQSSVNRTLYSRRFEFRDRY